MGDGARATGGRLGEKREGAENAKGAKGVGVAVRRTRASGPGDRRSPCRETRRCGEREGREAGWGGGASNAGFGPGRQEVASQRKREGAENAKSAKGVGVAVRRMRASGPGDRTSPRRAWRRG